jgi:hypothetical protein
MARSHRFQMRLISMTNTHHATMEELVVGKDLSWMDSFPAVHDPEAEYLTRNRKKKRPSKKEIGNDEDHKAHKQGQYTVLVPNQSRLPADDSYERRRKTPASRVC